MALKNRARNAEIIRLYQEEMLSTVQISKVVGISFSAVADILKRSGVKLRTSKEGLALRFPEGKFGEKHWNWKGGKRIQNGYYVVHILNHPRGGRNNRVFEHILVAERSMDRFLEKDEIVHHINGNKLDNSPDNLLVMKRKDHVGYHMKSGQSIQELLGRIEYLETLLKANNITFS